MRSFRVLLEIAVFVTLIALVIFRVYQPRLPRSPSLVPGATTSQQSSQTVSGNFVSPLDKPTDRVTKKKFGQYITPKTSPVQPERFSGYHTGVDFETFPEEQNIDVAIKAICTGTLKLKEFASGYGGVAIQECQLNNSPITVIYGHLRLASILANVGDTVEVGSKLGVLGTGYSPETDGERKHLHLGIHKGTEINIRGYVSTPQELNSFLDPCEFICHN